MKRFLLIILCFVVISAISCTNKTGRIEEVKINILENAVSSPSPEDTVSTTPLPPLNPTPSVPAERLSLTTGLPSEAEYKPVGVMIENHASARPQIGIQAADIVYEAVVEGKITRFFCLFNDNMPKVVGPVRSVRLYYIFIQKEWDSILVHYGGPSVPGKKSYVYGNNTDYIKIRVDGLKGKYNKYFWRDKRRPSVHSVCTDLTKVQALYNYTPNERKSWLFDKNIDYQTSKGFVTKVYVPFSAEKTYAWYKYNREKDVLIRYIGKNEFKDAATKKPVEVKNLIIQYVKYKYLGEGKGRKYIDMTGSGKAEYIIGGKHIKGAWERKDLNSRTVFKNDAGLEIVFKPGNTWVEVHPHDAAITVEYEDASA